MLWFELRYAFRLIRKSWSFAFLCVMTIAIGVGLSIVTYSSLSSAAYANLPVINGERFVAILTLNKETKVESAFKTIDAYASKFLRERLQGFDSLHVYKTVAVTLSDGTLAKRFSAAEIEPSLLAATESKPLLGRMLHASDAELGSEKVVLLGHGIWQGYYGSDVEIVGKTSRINGHLHTIVGVMAKGFEFPVSHDLWLPYRLPVDAQPSRKRDLDLVGVLTRSTAISDADREIAATFATLRQRYPERYGDRETKVVPYVQAFLANSMLAIYMLIAATITVLALVSINVSNLLLVRALERIQELAIRNALGASRTRLVQQVLMESLLICSLGGFIGLCIADLCMQVIRTEYILSGLASSFLPYWFDYTIDSHMIFVCTGTILAIWLISGGSAAIRVVRSDLNEILDAGSTGATGGGKLLFGRTLISLEVVLCSFLLIVSGTLVIAIQDARETDFGTATGEFLTANVTLPEEQYPDPNSRIEYLRDLETELESIPGVEGVGLTTALPSRRAPDVQYQLDDRDLGRDNRYPTQGLVAISTRYFDVMQVELLQGRNFSAEDDASVANVVIVDEYFANQMWPGESAIGKRIQISPLLGGEWLRIVGVSSHVIQGQPLRVGKSRTTLYRPLAQAPPSIASMALQVNEAPETFVKAVKHSAKLVNRDVPIERVQALDVLIQSSIGPLRVLGQVFLAVAIVTLCLSVVGIYGIISRAVIVRTSEMGIQRALGLTNTGLRMIFLKEGLWYIAVGIALGGSFGIVAVDSLADIFPEIMRFLPYVLTLVFTCIGFVILLACHLPATKIIRLEPGTALRYVA